MKRIWFWLCLILGGLWLLPQAYYLIIVLELGLAQLNGHGPDDAPSFLLVIPRILVLGLLPPVILYYLGLAIGRAFGRQSAIAKGRSE